MKKIRISKEELFDLYVNQKYSTRDIAKKLAVGQTSVRRWLDYYDIDTRKTRNEIETERFIEKQNIRAEALRKDEIRNCVVCGKEFSTKPHMNKKTCSKKCMGILTGSRAEKKVEVICTNCGKEFLRIPSRLTNSNNNFCSTTCFKEWQSNVWVGENSPFYSQVITNCGYCNKEISVIKSRYNAHEKVYCDYNCMSMDYQNRLVGENNPHWAGGLERKDYGSSWWSARRQTLVRDNYICQRCGKTEEENNEEMSVHHIRPFRLWDDSEKANDISNLVSVCRTCHDFIHSNANIEKEFLIE